MPILVRPGKSAHLDAKHKTDMVQSDFGDQALKTQPTFGGSPTLALVFVDDQNSLFRPAVPLREAS